MQHNIQVTIASSILDCPPKCPTSKSTNCSISIGMSWIHHRILTFKILAWPGIEAYSLRQTFSVKLKLQHCKFTLHVDRQSSKSELENWSLCCVAGKHWLRIGGAVPFRSQFNGAQTQSSCLDGSDWTCATTAHTPMCTHSNMHTHSQWWTVWEAEAKRIKKTP